MELSRRQKYVGHKHTAVKTAEKIKLGFDLNTLNLFCSYIISGNRNVKRSQLINIRNLFAVLDLSEYSDEEKLKRIQFIQKGLEARLDHNLNDPVMILKHINGGFIDEDLLDIENFSTLSNTELEWLNGTVNKSLNYSFIYSDIDMLINTAMKFKAGEYTTKDAAAIDLENVINKFHSEFRRNRARASSDEMFSLVPDKFEACIRQFHSEITNPSRKLRTGLTAMNTMLKGGFENQRVYFYFGLPGEGKSVTLLDLAIQIKKYNKDLTPKDPTKRPCVVYLTMENSERETIERIWDMVCDRGLMANYTPEEVMDILRTEGELYLSDDNPIDIIIKYVPGETVDTGYLYTLVEDLEDDGYECICMIQDYIKRIRSVYNSNAEIRVQYGSIVNEFKVFAILKDIPLISASQLNRDATKHIDEGRKTNKADLVRLFGRSNIGESQLILENIDAGMFIAPEYDIEGNKFLGIQMTKTRFGESAITSFYQPYTVHSPIKLVEDADLDTPVYRLTMRPDQTQVQVRFNTEMSPANNIYQTNIVKEYDDIALLHSEAENIYSQASLYSSNRAAMPITMYYNPMTNETKPLTKPLIKYNDFTKVWG